MCVCEREREREDCAEAVCVCRSVSLHDYLADVCMVVAMVSVEACMNVLRDCVCVCACVCMCA